MKVARENDLMELLLSGTLGLCHERPVISTRQKGPFVFVAVAAACSDAVGHAATIHIQRYTVRQSVWGIRSHRIASRQKAACKAASPRFLGHAGAEEAAAARGVVLSRDGKWAELAERARSVTTGVVKCLILIPFRTWALCYYHTRSPDRRRKKG
jgi:hypothetical protein